MHATSNNYDLIRFLAALQVVFVHAVHHFEVAALAPAIPYVQLLPGVPIFFVVSGYLVSSSYNRSPSLMSYSLNRFLRVYPALFVCFLFTAAICVFVFGIDPWNQEFLVWAVAQLTVVQFYNPDFLRDYAVGVINGSLWTIPVELQFYALLPVLAWCLNRTVRYRATILVLCFVLLVAVQQLYFHYLAASGSMLVKLFGVTVLPYLFYFALGWLLQEKAVLVGRVIRFWPLVLLVYLILASVLDRFGIRVWGNYMNPLSGAILGILIVLLAYVDIGKFRNMLLGNDVSYGLYIYHMPLVNLWLYLELRKDMAGVAILVIVALFLSFVSWQVIEKPALRLKRSTLLKR